MKFFIYLFQLAGAERVMIDYAYFSSSKIFCIKKDDRSIEKIRKEFSQDDLQIINGFFNFLKNAFQDGVNLVFLNRAGLIFSVLNYLFNLDYLLFVHSMPPRNSLKRFLIKFVFKKASKIIFISKKQKNAYLNMNLLNSNKRYFLLENPISSNSIFFLKNYKKINFLFNRAIVNFGICSRDDPLKNIDHGVECFKIAGTKFNSLEDNTITLKLILAGRGTVRFNNKNNKTIFSYGELPSKNFNLINFYEKIDCLILPSIEEVSPIVVYEALCSGIPIIANDVGDLQELSLKFQWIYIIKNNSKVQMSNKIFNVSKNINSHRSSRLNRIKQAKNFFLEDRTPEKLMLKLKGFIYES